MKNTWMLPGRNSVAWSPDFVRAWLLKEDAWRADRFTSVIVVFEDEQSQAPAGAPSITDTRKQ